MKVTIQVDLNSQGYVYCVAPSRMPGNFRVTGSADDWVRRGLECDRAGRVSVESSIGELVNELLDKFDEGDAQKEHMAAWAEELEKEAQRLRRAGHAMHQPDPIYKP